MELMTGFNIACDMRLKNRLKSILFFDFKKLISLILDSSFQLKKQKL